MAPRKMAGKAGFRGRLEQPVIQCDQTTVW